MMSIFCKTGDRFFYRSIALSVLLLSVVLSNVNAQQEPLYTNYTFNTVSLNPAYAGTRNAMNMLFLSRLQWVGVDGAPRTYTFTVHAPIDNYRMGIGFSVVSDNIGPVRNSYFNVNYAYRVKLSENTTLSMGLKAGFYNYYVGLQDVFLGNTGNDDAFNSNLSRRFQPNAGFGLYMYHPKYYVGFSIPKLIEENMNDQENNSTVLDKLKRHYYLMAGYVFDLGSDLKFKPSFIEKAVQGAPPSTDLTVQFIYKNILWLGTSYRVGDAVAILSGVQINRQMFIGYSYDCTTSAISTFSHGSHEIVVSYDFDGFSAGKVKSPRYF